MLAHKIGGLGWRHFKAENRGHRSKKSSPRERDKDPEVRDHAHLSRASITKGKNQRKQREDQAEQDLALLGVQRRWSNWPSVCETLRACYKTNAVLLDLDFGHWPAGWWGRGSQRWSRLATKRKVRCHQDLNSTNIFLASYWTRRTRGS